jgi:hypothetical protein
MLITLDIHTFVPAAATAAMVWPCSPELDSERRSGYNQALVRRCAR